MEVDVACVALLLGEQDACLDLLSDVAHKAASHNPTFLTETMGKCTRSVLFVFFFWVTVMVWWFDGVHTRTFTSCTHACTYAYVRNTHL